MQHDELQRPLSKGEVRELHAILEDEAAGLVPAALDGFLTAVGSAPTGLPPSAWLPTIFGEREFASQEDVTRCAGLVLRRYNEVLRRTANPDTPWPPASLGDEEITDWCHGYMQIARADPKWLDDEWAHNQLISISVLAGEFDLVGEEDADGNIIEDAMPFRVRYCRMLPETVSKLDDYWRKQRRMEMQRLSPVPVDKPARNDPCPCDSGRKYKKCCGRPG